MLNKYVQFFRDNGFFAGSKIKAQITDSSYIGKEITLSKGADVLQTQTVPASGKVEFFTDDSGELTVSSDNGTAVISGTVEVTNYATYNVTLDGAHSDITREVYPNKENIVFDLSTASDTVKFAYTGDKATATASSNDDNVATARVNNNIVTVTKANNETDGNCVIAVTIPSTSKFQQKSFNINVSKQGRVGTWADASNETLVNMVAAADRGELNLRDYWNVGDIRRVTLQSISPVANSVMNAQPQQTIELMLLYDSISDTKYELVEETISHRNRPSFVVGLKNCLENLSPIDYDITSKTLSTAYSDSMSFSESFDFYQSIKSSGTTKLDKWLNENFYNALPTSIATILKSVKVIYNDLILQEVNYAQNAPANYSGVYSKRGTKNQKIALPSSYEVVSDKITSSIGGTGATSYTIQWVGASVVTYKGSFGTEGGRDNFYTYANDNQQDYSKEGTQMTYYSSASERRIKKRGINGEACQYYTRSSADTYAISAYNRNQSLERRYILTEANAIIDTSGRSRSVSKEDYASTYAGISPIMFI